IGHGMRQFRPEVDSREYLPKVRTMPRVPSTTMKKPLAAQIAITTRNSRPAPPKAKRPPEDGGSPPPSRRRRPNRSASRRLKLRQSSSRSGGPWLPPPGPPLEPSGPREPRPQFGSFNDMGEGSVRLQWLRGRRGRAARRRALLRELGNRGAQAIQSCTGARAHENAAD